MNNIRSHKSLTNKLLQYLGVIAALLLLGAIIFYGFFSQPYAFEDGEVKLDCLTNNVEIIIDRNQIPHIYTNNSTDAFRAVGYIQAARHLKTMDNLLRVATGRMAAVHGKRFVDIDIAARRLGFSSKARQIQSRLSPQASEILAAYCDGVNAFIKTQRKSVAQQFRPAGYEPLEWKPDECLAIFQLYQWSCCSPWDEKIVLYKTREVFGQERTVAGFPIIDDWPQSQIEYKDIFFAVLNKLYQDGTALRQAAGLSPGNNQVCVWALSERQAAIQGGVIGLETNYLEPQTMLMDLVAPELHFFGLLIPGMPVGLAGCNDHNAWGFNQTMNPNVNIYMVTVAPARTQFLAPDGWNGLTKRSEKIAVKNAPDRTIDIYQADAKVLLDFTATRTDSVVQVAALAWQGLSAEEINGQVAMLLGRNPAETSGENIPFNGLVCNSRGTFSNETKGQSFVTESVAQAGCLTDFSTNDSLLARNFSYALPTGLYYPEYQGHRMAAIARYLNRNPGISTAELSRYSTLDADKYFALIIENIRPAITDTNFTKTLELAAYQALLEWNGRYEPTAVAPVIYRTFVMMLLRNIFGDELDLVDAETYRQFAGSDDFAIRNLVLILKEGQSSWFDNLSTPEVVEWQGEIIRQSFRETVDYLESHYSANLSEWQWRRVDRVFLPVNSAVQKHQVADVPSVRTLLMSPAGTHTEIYLTPIEPGIKPNNLYRSRFEIIRNGTRVLTLKAPSSR